MWQPNVCPVCGSWKPARWNLCLVCLRTYGDRSEWPEWLVFLVSAHWADRRRARRAGCSEMLVPTEDIAANWYSDKDDPDRSGDVEEGCNLKEGIRGLRIGELLDRDGGGTLPYAPYDDPEQNRQYRLANGIKETN